MSRTNVTESPCIARSSAAMVLTVQDVHVLGNHWYDLKCRELLENAISFLGLQNKKIHLAEDISEAN